MALVLDEEQQMLRDSAMGFLAEHAPVSALRELRDTRDENGFSRALWKTMAEMGWAGILVPESYGGSEFGVSGAGVILEAMGRHLTASPMFSTAVLGTAALVAGGSDAQKDMILPKVAAGDHLLALAIDEGPKHNPQAIATRGTPSGNGFRLNGSKTFVLDGHTADHLIVAARTEGEDSDEEGITLFLVDRTQTGVSVDRTIMVDSRNAAEVEFNDVDLSGDAVIGEVGKGRNILRHVLNIGRAVVSAEMLGVATESFDRTIDYLKERKQFGTPIGAFQAIQHRASHLFCELELAKSAVIKALSAIDAKDEHAETYASLAKAKLSQTAKLATKEAIQMHGGIGMTDEFDIGFFIKRAQAAQECFGDFAYHADQLARARGY
ncbi:MAG: acyl-CoA dehydrogenase [Pseudomonadota bacterium]